jgi:hypothetical protein
VSEFSASYHIRTTDQRVAQQRLRQAKISGIVFGPANGWLTFVPYANLDAFRSSGDPANFAAPLSRILDAPVIYYNYAEDHGWGFALAQAGRCISRFACWWDPAAAIERELLDLEVLTPFGARTAIEPLLEPYGPGGDPEDTPAYHFAELLELPAYRWLSPDLAQRHTSDLLAQGGRKVGTKPRDTAEQMSLPPNRRLTLPRADLSAREALAIVEPFAAGFKSPWHLASLSGGGGIQDDGRNNPRFGMWCFTYRDVAAGKAIDIRLYGMGSLSFQGDIMPSFTESNVAGAAPLSNDWLDSTEIALIASRQEVPREVGELAPGSFMRLAPQKGMPLCWEITREALHRDSDFRSWKLAIEATSGQVVFERLSRAFGAWIVPVRQRFGRDEWQAMPPPEWAAAAKQGRI